MTHQPAYRTASYQAYLCPEVIEGVSEPEGTELFITVEVCVHCGAIVADRWQHNRWHEQLLPQPKAKPRKRTPPTPRAAPPEPALRLKRDVPTDDQIRCSRVLNEVQTTGPDTSPVELARRLHMDVREVHRHLRTLGYNTKPPE
jgi:hypothetical protein